MKYIIEKKKATSKRILWFLEKLPFLYNKKTAFD